MVHYCVVCKLSQGVIKDVMFHRFPTNESKRKHWLISINRENVAKSGRICSQHFKCTDYEIKEQKGTVLKVLSSDAVPSLLLNDYDSSSANYRSEQNIESTVNLTNISTSHFETNPLSIHLSNNKPEFQERVPSEQVSDIPPHNIDSLESNENISSNIIQSSETCDKEQISLKRASECNSPVLNVKRVRKIRYVGDLRPEDFSSTEAYEVLRKYLVSTKAKLRLKNQTIIRMDKRMDNLKNLLTHLKDTGLITNEGFDSIKMFSSPALHEIIKNMLSTKKCNSYTNEFKDFACSLLFYSTAAYVYLRKSFLNSLPSPQTVRRWFAKIDLSPGISQPVLLSVRQMIEKERANKKDLQFSLQIDEMSIKKQVELRNNTWYGFTDIGVQKNKSEEASYALVFMIVCINGHFKTPIAYYFLKSLSGEGRANILKEILLVLHENGISDIRSVTFDGASTNMSMVECLGANVKNADSECYFEHPATAEPIFVIPDACHMLKLIRNATSQYTLYDDANDIINWQFIKKLVEIQEQEGLHVGTKIRRRHIDFHREKMKVKLAAQVFSTRVSDALIYMKTISSDFEGADATALFCKNINNAFDILNSKCKFGKTKYQNGISRDNIEMIENKITNLVKYIKSLKYNDNGKIKSILTSARKTGFWGFIVGLQNSLSLAKYLFENQITSYLLTYKLSQDHLETYFSAIRRMGGFNNNPTCYQFECSYKKLITHVNSVIVPQGNCSLQDGTTILKTEDALKKDVLNCPLINFDHDYSVSGSFWSLYKENVITYIAGYVVRCVKKIITCEMCIDCIEAKENYNNLTGIKNKLINLTSNIANDRKSGLVFPSSDVINICKVCEKIIRSENIFATKNVVERLMLRARSQLLPMHVFDSLNCLMEPDLICNHKMKLINLITKKFFILRLHHEASSLKDHIQRIRTYHNRIIVFKNQ